MHAFHMRRRQRENRGADIAANLAIVTSALHDVGHQCGCRRFAVGSGDGDKGRPRRLAAPLATKQLDIADHFDCSCSRQTDRPVRSGMSERYAWGEHQR